MTREIDHSLNGCQRDIYELRRELRNERRLSAEIVARCEATIEELRVRV